MTLPAPLRGRTFRLEILRAAFARGASGRVRQRRAVGIAEIAGTGVPRANVPRAGALHGRCGDLVGDLSGTPLALRVTGTIADFDAGRPLRVRGCGTLALPAGAARLSLPASALAPYLLRLRSPGTAVPAAAPGRVLSAGRATRSGRTGVRLDVRAPARLVLAESYTAGRLATCDGHDLGAPAIGDAFGTAWRVPAGCRDVEIAFAPNRLVHAGYAASLVAGAVLLVLLGLPRRRTARGAGVVRRGEPSAGGALAGGAPAAGGVPASGGGPPARMSARRAAVLAVPLALALGFLFAARATPLFGAAAFLILWRAIDARRLALAAGALLVFVVPVLTLAIGVKNPGGYNPSYAGDRVAVHWAAVAAVVLLLFALGRELRSSRSSAATARGR